MSTLSVCGNWIAGAGFGIALVGFVSGTTLAMSLLGFVLAVVGLALVVWG